MTPTNTPARGLKRRVRDLLLNSWLHRLLGPRVQTSLIHVAYLGRFSAWLEEHGLEAGFESRAALYEHLHESEGLDGPCDYLEFGVFEGRSISWWSDRIKDPSARFVGFDTFQGLPEGWAGQPAGALTTEGRTPDIDDSRVSFRAGLFQDTLPGFVEQQPLDRRLIVNLDADLYSSTLFVLATLAPRLKKGDLLIFDEIGSVREPTAEFRALLDFASAFRVDYTPLAASPQYKVIGVRIE